MSEQEKNDRNTEEEEARSTSEQNDMVPQKEKTGKPISRQTPEPIRDEEFPMVRYRRRSVGFRMTGIAVAVFVLLLAVLLVCMAAGKDRTETPDETTAGNGDDTTASDETTGEVRDLYEFNPESVPEGHTAFRPMDLSGESGTITNQTALTPDLAALLARYAEGEAASEGVTLGDPLVLILHTHTTEGYSADGAVSWDGSGELARSENKAENIVAVGAALTEALNARGIPTIHCEIFHDITEDGIGTYSGSYARAKETIEHYLALYPSILYVIDLHRDAVTDTDGNLIRTVVEADVKATAQIMAVVGSSENGTAFDWESNLAVALALTERLNADFDSLCRAPVLRSASFNQELAAHSLILEIGTAANSLEEALRAVELAADGLAELILTIESTETAEG